MDNQTVPLEIERKFLISMPNCSFLEGLPGCTVSHIDQTYLVSPAPGMTERIRRRIFPSKTVFTHTVKFRLSATTVREDESEISEDEFNSLLLSRDPSLQTVSKTRYAFFLDNQSFEVDVYPFWQKTAVLETELKHESDAVTIPPFLTVLKEVTGEKAYTNHSLAGKIPPEPNSLK